MKTSLFIIALMASTTFIACGQSKVKSTENKTSTTQSKADWKNKLSPLAYEVMVNKDTEMPFKNPYYNNHEKGIYVSAATGEPLFSSDDKFDSGTGWPSFTKPLNPNNVAVAKDESMGMSRDEVVERSTGLHLGHLFNDGPQPSGMRYCINSAALRFVKSK
jgi:peptide-methionine (R)-S-oxide reductase